MPFVSLLRAFGQLRLFVLAALALAPAACRANDDVVHVYDPYEGDPPYPSRRPKLALAQGDFGLVTNSGDDTITALDLVHGNVLATVPVGRDPVAIDGPHHVAIDPNVGWEDGGASGFAYIALSYPSTFGVGPHASHGGSIRSGWVQKLALSDLRIVGEVRVDPNPGDIVLSDDGRRLVVSHFDLAAAQTDAGLEEKRANLAILDPQTIVASGSPDPVRRTVCIAPHGIALSRPDGAVAYVACYGEDSLAIVRLDDPSAPIVRVPVGPSPGQPGYPSYGPYSAVLSPDGKRIAIGDTVSNDLRVFDVESGQMEPFAVAAPGAVYFPAWSPDGTTLYVPTQARDTLRVVDASTGAVTSVREFDTETCLRPHEVMLGSDGSQLYLVCEGDQKTPSVVLALDPKTLETTKRYPVGVFPDRVLVRRRS